MGNRLFGIDIAGLVAANIGPGVLDATIKVFRLGGRASPTSGRERIATSHKARGFWMDYSPAQVDGELVRINDRRALIIGDTIPAGVRIGKGSEITMAGATLVVQKLESADPAEATFIFQCRDTAGADSR